MIDDDDVDWAGTMFSMSSGWSALIFLIVLIALAVICFKNDEDCKKKNCPAPLQSMLLKGECRCVGTPE